VYDEVGFIHILSKEIWEGHPCCSFGVPADFVKQNPNTFAALYRADADRRRDGARPEKPLADGRGAVARQLPEPAKTVLEQVLTGKFADGLGNVQNVPESRRLRSLPVVLDGLWILTQMKRWGYVKGEVNYKDIAEKVYLLTDAKKYMTEVGMAPPKETMKKFKVMGKEFDPQGRTPT
jgi:nitrate/nitrite transport system substrate-binding protein